MKDRVGCPLPFAYQDDMGPTLTAEHPTSSRTVTAAEQQYAQPPVVAETQIVYPESDGEPMGETGIHVHATLHLYGALRHFFQPRDDVYVAADMFLYYEEGNPQVKKAPDVMVIQGVSSHERRIFKTWEEQAVPGVIFEVTSKSTMADDMFTKSHLYAKLGVREYFLFDPLQEYLSQALLGFRLEDSQYVPIPADDDGQMESRELGVLLRPEHTILRMIDRQTGKRVPSLEEAAIWAEQEAQRAERETQRAERETQRAERFAAQLRAAGIEPEM